MESIEALLTALKQHEGNTANMAPSSSSSADSISGLADAADSDPSQSDSEDDDSGDAAHNAKIVSALETNYPKTYAKICADIGSDDEPDDSSGQTGFPSAAVS